MNPTQMAVKIKELAFKYADNSNPITVRQDAHTALCAEIDALAAEANRLQGLVNIAIEGFQQQKSHWDAVLESAKSLKGLLK